MQSIWRSSSQVQSDIVLGIDFGTSNSCVAVWRPDKKRVKIIKNTLKPIGKRTTPSSITFHDSFNQFTIGDAALTDAASEAEFIDESRRVSAIKRCLGGTDSVCNDEVIGRLVHFNKDDGKISIRCTNKKGAEKLMEPEELASHIISYLKNIAEQYLDRRPFKGQENPKSKKINLHKVVIGVPANYTDRQKDAIKSAAALSGFDEVHLMVESTAAAMSYGLLVAGSKNVLVVDIGGGTLDLTVLNINDGVHNVEAVAGHMNLGGCLMDVRLCDLVEKKFSEALLRDRATDKSKAHLTPELVKSICNDMRPELLRLCKICKEELSDATEASITIPVVYLPFVDAKKNIKGPHVYVSRKTPSENDTTITVTRQEFETIIQDITNLVTASVKHIIEQWIAQKASTGTGIDIESCLDEIVLVGGASRVPAIRVAIRAACEQLRIGKFCSSALPTPHELCTALNPDEIVAEGLALRGAILSGADTGMLKDVLMMDCMAMSIGVMSWSSGGGSDVDGRKVTSASQSRSSTTSGGDDRVFEAILFKGDKIPARRGKRFRLADNRQKFVSLDIYEEIDQLEASNDASGSQAVTVFRHHLISTVDVPVPRPPSSGYGSGGDGALREIEVVFCMDERGFLSYETYECDPATGVSEGATVVAEGRRTGGSNSNEVGEPIPDESSRKTMFFLGVYLIMMVCLYLAAKIFLVEVIENPNRGSRLYDDDRGVSTDSSVVSDL